MLVSDQVNKKKSIVLESASGFENIGDEAILAANLQVLRESLGDEYEFVVLSFHPEKTAKIHNVSSKPSFIRVKGRGGRIGIVKALWLSWWLLWNARRLKKGKSIKFLSWRETELLKTLAYSEALLVVGGGNLNDLYRWGGLFSKGVEIFVAKTLDKPVFLGAQTVGPLRKKWTRALAKRVLENADFITLREKCSSDVIKELGIKHNRIRVAPDDSFYVDPINEMEAKRLLKNEKLDLNRIKRPGRKIIALNTRPWWKRKPKDAKLKKALEDITRFLIKEGHFLVFVSTAYTCSPAYNDMNAAKELLRNLKPTQNAWVLQNRYNWSQLKGILGLMDAAVGVSYHFAVFATSMGVPTIGLYQDEYYRLKLQGFFELIGFDKWAIDVSKIDQHMLIENVKKMLQKSDELKRTLLSRVKLMRKDSCIAARQLVAYLKHKTG